MLAASEGSFESGAECAIATDIISGGVMASLAAHALRSMGDAKVVP
jgi:hypothetical protein